MSLTGEDLDYMFSALSHEVRRAIIKHLGEAEILSFSELMERAGIKETGTFGFHLKKVEPLLEKLPDGRYRLSQLGERAYRLLSFLEKPELFEKPEGGVKTLRGFGKLLLDAERLKRYESVVIEDCGEVLIDSDVTPELFEEKVLSFRRVGRILAPKPLYRPILRRLEEYCGSVETYEGELPLEGKPSRKYLENYGELVVDALRLKPGMRIENYGRLTLRNLTEENVKNIADIENYGVIRVPKGFKELILMRVSENHGRIEEYE